MKTITRDDTVHGQEYVLRAEAEAEIQAAERERWRGLVREALDADEGDYVLGKGLADRMRAALRA